MPRLSDEAYLDAVERGRAVVTAHLAPAPGKAEEVAAEGVSPSQAAPNVPRLPAEQAVRGPVVPVVPFAFSGGGNANGGGRHGRLAARAFSRGWHLLSEGLQAALLATVARK